MRRQRLGWQSTAADEISRVADATVTPLFSNTFLIFTAASIPCYALLPVRTSNIWQVVGSAATVAVFFDKTNPRTLAVFCMGWLAMIVPRTPSDTNVERYFYRITRPAVWFHGGVALCNHHDGAASQIVTAQRTSAAADCVRGDRYGRPRLVHSPAKLEERSRCPTPEHYVRVFSF